MKRELELQKDELLKKEHQKVTKLLTEWYKPESYQNLEQFIEELKVLQKFLFNNNKIYLLWGHQKFLPLYISEGVSQFGYTPQEIYNLSLFQALKRVYWKQIPLVMKLHKDGDYFGKLTKNSPRENIEHFICGAKIKDRWGNVRTFFARQKYLSVTKTGSILISFIEVEEISGIVKGEVGWSRMIDHTYDIPIKRVFFADKTIANELLSNREIDILKLIIEKKDSTTIASDLNISVETVKKHRKNMIARVGAKDTTALIYLCQQAGVI